MQEEERNKGEQFLKLQKLHNDESFYGGGKKINLKTVIKRINRICTKRKSYWGKKDVYIKYQVQEKIM